MTERPTSPAGRRRFRWLSFGALASAGAIAACFLWYRHEAALLPAETRTVAAGQSAAILVAAGVIAGWLLQAWRQERERSQKETGRLLDLFEHTPDSLFLIRVTPEQRFVYELFNPIAEYLTGLTQAEVEERDVAEVLPPALAPILLGHYRRCLETGSTVNYDLEIPLAEGQRRLFHTFLVPIRDENGLIQRIAGFSRDITDRQRAEQALRESEERFSRVFHASLNAIAVSDLTSGRFLDVNAGFESLFGYSRDEVVGHTAQEIDLWAQPEERTRMFEALRRQEGSLRDFQASGRKRNGEHCICLVSAEIVAIAGRPALAMVTRDITASLRAEQALRESEEKFSKAFQASPDAIAVSDLETGKVLDVNLGFERVFGYSREQAINRTVLEMGLWALPEERTRMLDSLRRQQGSVRDFQGLGRKRSGEMCICLISAEVVAIAGRPSLVTVTRDITASLRAEQALRESEEKFSKAFQAGPDAIVISDFQTGRLIEANEGFRRIFGYARDEIVGRSTFELDLWADPTDRDRIVAALRNREPVRDWELQVRTRRRGTATLLLSAEMIELGGGLCALTVMHDITDRKRAEAEREEAERRERRAREDFTRQLIVSQESERRRIAGELHDSLGQNLLLLKNRARLALEAGASAEERRSQLEAMQDLTAEAISEVRRISHDLRPYQLDQLGLTRALEGMISSAARGAGLPIEHKLDPIDDLFPAEAATNLYRVVQEAITNMLKHSQAKRARILLERDLHQTRLWIEDDGRGFSAEARPAAEIGGFGLKNMAERVRLLEGTLKVDTAPEQGTRIEVTIPLREPS